MIAEATGLITASTHTRSSPDGRWRSLLTGMLALLILTACSSQPRTLTSPASADDDRRQTAVVVETALAQLDKPYRYGGKTPRGFDCSGLVYYVYRHNGIGIPRTALDQQRRARPVPLGELAPGDLLFFREREQKASHVGLYVGKGHFVHASTSRQSVTLSRIDNPYWRESLISAGRYGQ